MINLKQGIDLLEANDLLRSCYAVVQRRGAETNWEALEARLIGVLEQHRHFISSGVGSISPTATPRTFRLIEEKPAPVTNLSNERNDTNTVLEYAMTCAYDEVFVIGVVNGQLHTTNSGYMEFERKVGMLEMLKMQMLLGAKNE